ncbi:MAG: hypothetical protein K2L55_05540 [Muribaculaceae bacterium]|nr:hypothetical protein [Muribaculaceae bacterium]
MPLSCPCCNRHVKAPRGQLQSYNYLADVPGGYADSEYVEVLFKNTRKGFYKNPTGIALNIGDWVAVEATPGHDIGRVTMIGALVKLQMRKAGVKNESDLKRIFRKARPADMEKFEEAKSRENSTMIRSRKIAESLQLNMKIGDVEYQGDGNKAIFYYIADERVDFRQLIKVLAETFKVRIEMKQIGARQEAGRIGGIGPCGRPLCCATWMTNFVSVATSAARYQDISLNPQKLAGQCAKLKCCLNFEVDTYVESVKRMPGKDVRLETADATYFYFKVDIFKREITYSTDKSIAANLVTIDADRAFEIIRMNKAGEKPLSLKREGEEEPKAQKYNDILDQDNLNRFDNKKRKKKPKGQKPAQRDEKARDGQPAEQPARDGQGDDKSRRDNRQRDNRRRQRPAQGNDAPQGEGEGAQQGNRRRDDNNRRDRRQGQENRQPRRDNRPQSSDARQQSDGAAPNQVARGNQRRDNASAKSNENEA